MPAAGPNRTSNVLSRTHAECTSTRGMPQHLPSHSLAQPAGRRPRGRRHTMDNYKGAPPSTSSTTLGYVVSPHGCSGVRRHFELFAQTNDEHSTPIHKRPPTLSWSTNFTASVHGYRAVFNSRFPHPLRVKAGAVNSHKCCARSDDVGDEPHTKYKSRISECRRTGACNDNTLRTERPEHAIPQRCNGFASPASGGMYSPNLSGCNFC